MSVTLAIRKSDQRQPVCPTIQAHMVCCSDNHEATAQPTSRRAARKRGRPGLAPACSLPRLPPLVWSLPAFPGIGARSCCWALRL